MEDKRVSDLKRKPQNNFGRINNEAMEDLHKEIKR